MQQCTSFIYRLCRESYYVFMLTGMYVLVRPNHLIRTRYLLTDLKQTIVCNMKITSSSEMYGMTHTWVTGTVVRCLTINTAYVCRCCGRTAADTVFTSPHHPQMAVVISWRWCPGCLISCGIDGRGFSWMALSAFVLYSGPCYILWYRKGLFLCLW